MTDREVGELWRQAHNEINENTPVPLSPWVENSIQLIRKLVEERARHYVTTYRKRDEVTQEFACGDFGIDPKEFK